MTWWEDAARMDAAEHYRPGPDLSPQYVPDAADDSRFQARIAEATRRRRENRVRYVDVDPLEGGAQT